MPAGGYFNQVSAVVSIVIYKQIIIVLTPPCIIVCSFIGKLSILKHDKEYFGKWGSLFCEFKNNKGFWSTQYYFVFFLRRLGFLLTQVYLNANPYWQGSLNIFGSLVQTGFLLCYRPYKENSMLISTIIGEITSTLAISLSFSFMFITSQKITAIVEETTTFIIIIGMGSQVLISFYVMIKSFYLIWKKIEKIRALNFIEKAKSISAQGFAQMRVF